jgi:hypothetical protein
VWQEKGVAKSDGKEDEAKSIDSKKVCSSLLILVPRDYEGKILPLPGEGSWRFGHLRNSHLLNP